jgi:hypothetical protein
MNSQALLRHMLHKVPKRDWNFINEGVATLEETYLQIIKASSAIFHNLSSLYQISFLNTYFHH